MRLNSSGIWLALAFSMSQSHVHAQSATQPQPHPGPATAPATAAVQPLHLQRLAEAPEPERAVLSRMMRDESWPRRAIAILRLERYSCEDARERVVQCLSDDSWQVRGFAVRSLARRRIFLPEGWSANETEPRVFRTALRHQVPIDPSRIHRAVRLLAKSNDLSDKMLAVELAACSSDDELKKDSIATLKQIILRMDRAESGLLSSRLAVVTGQRDMHRPFEWREWLMKHSRRIELKPPPALDIQRQQVEPSLMAKLESEEFAGLEDYMAALGNREIDLAICLDCTASMYGELAAAQGGIDDMMLFVGDMVGRLRVGLVAYRDRRDEFETKAWDFTDQIDEARKRLWQLSAAGGGDHPESVLPAIKLALKDLHWKPASAKVLVLVGDAPPHPGYGAHCIDLIERARAQASLTAHVIQAEAKEVKHFPEIAKAGGGRCVSLEDDDSLMAEITGLTLGDRYEQEFREFFHLYLELCR